MCEFSELIGTRYLARIWHAILSVLLILWRQNMEDPLFYYNDYCLSYKLPFVNIRAKHLKYEIIIIHKN